MNEQPALLPAVETDTMREVARLVGVLSGKGWMKASELLGILPEWNDRKLRTVASASGGQVLSYPGSPGYHLTIEASAVEREHAAAALRTQAVAMGDRAGDILRVHHSCQRPAELVQTTEASA
jgi:hypothetical protein